MLFLNRNLFPCLAPGGITDFGIRTPHKPSGPYGRLSGDGYDFSPVPGVEFEALAMQQRETLIISFSFWESETCQGTFDLQHLAHCISSSSG